MNWTVYLWECVGSVALFTALILIPLSRNPLWWIHDYPPDIQERYFETHPPIPVQPLSGTVLLKKLTALAVCTAALVPLVRLAGADSFGTGFLYSYGLWLVVDWYDCLILDWVVFASWRRIRLPGTEDMDRAYHQRAYHAVHSLIGMALGLVPCLLCGWAVTLMG